MRTVTDKDGDVLFAAQRKPFATLEAAAKKLVPVLAARLWDTCLWDGAPGVDWNIGDYRFLILSAEPEPDVSIYIQFWSEPHEAVSAEVSSGEWSPGTRKYVSKQVRTLLASLEYEKEGTPANFHKVVTIANAADAEAAALEAVRILYDGFGYRGQWPLWFRPARESRAGEERVHTSLTPEDFAKVAAIAGFDARVVDDEGPDDTRVLLRRGRRRFVAFMEDQEPGQNLFAVVGLRAVVQCGHDVSDAELLKLGGAMRLVQLHRLGEMDEIGVSLSLRLAGGVTTAWLIGQLAAFIASWKYMEPLLKRTAGRQRRRPSTVIH
jgi:hypothetical protein